MKMLLKKNVRMNKWETTQMLFPVNPVPRAKQEGAETD
jgi:hypothetical protein